MTKGFVRNMLTACAALMCTMQMNSAEAATLTVDQISNSANTVGVWHLVTPNGHNISNHAKTQSRSTQITEAGQYLLRITPPKGAVTFITMLSATELPKRTTGTELRTHLDPSQDYRIIIRYDYKNTVKVNSNPQNAPFELRGPNREISYSGVTPASFSDLPPYVYTLHYKPIVGCVEPKPQKRQVSARQNLAFNAQYMCDLPQMQFVEPTARTNDELNGKVSVLLTTNQSETIAGNAVKYTLSVRNHSKRTQHNLSASFQFDPSTMEIRSALPMNGSVYGSNTARWTIPTIYAGQTWKVEFPVHILNSVDEGTKIPASARVSGAEIDPKMTYNLQSNVLVGTAVLPSTGWNTSTIFLIASFMLALLSLLINRQKSQQVYRES